MPSNCLKFAALAFFAVISLLHLFFPKYKNQTKALLLPSIILYCVLSSEKQNTVLICALAASWLGDVLLINPKNSWFTAGGISFMVSHLLFVIAYIPGIDFAAVKILPCIAAALVYCGIAAAVILSVRKNTPKPMVIPMYMYLIFNGTMNLFALMRLMSCGSIAGVIAYIGAVLFFISDCSLFMNRFRKDMGYKGFLLVMGTYITGEFLIAQGLIM